MQMGVQPQLPAVLRAPGGLRENRMAGRFVYESHDPKRQWCQSPVNELYEFDENGLTQRREASIHDGMIQQEGRKFRWELGARPLDSPGLTEMRF
jgi:nuclear transport factor 2 (NTF2) superfamily protein